MLFLKFSFKFGSRQNKNGLGRHSYGRANRGFWLVDRTNKSDSLPSGKLLFGMKSSFRRANTGSLEVGNVTQKFWFLYRMLKEKVSKIRPISSKEALDCFMWATIVIMIIFIDQNVSQVTKSEKFCSLTGGGPQKRPKNHKVILHRFWLSDLHQIFTSSKS